MIIKPKKIFELIKDGEYFGQIVKSKYSERNGKGSIWLTIDFGNDSLFNTAVYPDITTASPIYPLVDYLIATKGYFDTDNLVGLAFHFVTGTHTIGDRMYSHIKAIKLELEDIQNES